MRPTIMEVDTGAFNSNIREIQKYVGNKKLMPVIKANGYGTYINKNLDVINQFDIVAVAIVDEAVELRQLGYSKDIFILNQPYFEDIEVLSENDIIIGLSDKSFLDKLIEKGCRLRVHLEIETGMNRTGIKLDELTSFIERVKKAPNIVVEGVYTHLSSADFDDDYTNMQLDIFKKAVNIIQDNFDTIKYVHSSASNGLLRFDDGVSNLVRPGIIMYGYESYNGVKDLINIKPICKLKTKVTFIKTVDKGSAISYSQKYRAGSEIKVATIPIGYADGIRRALTNNGFVVINGKKAPIIGTVCMDSFMVDITGIEDVKVGSDVFIWDNELITVEQIADECGTINYEILSGISNRVIRKFI